MSLRIRGREIRRARGLPSSLQDGGHAAGVGGSQHRVLTAPAAAPNDRRSAGSYAFPTRVGLGDSSGISLLDTVLVPAMLGPEENTWGRSVARVSASAAGASQTISMPSTHDSLSSVHDWTPKRLLRMFARSRSMSTFAMLSSSRGNLEAPRFFDQSGQRLEHSPRSNRRHRGPLGLTVIVPLPGGI